MNPYAAHLGNRNAREVIAETPARLEGLAGQLGAAGLKRSLAPGKWSAGAILCHLAECEVAFVFRLKQALAEPYHVIQPFDQDAWSASYESLDARAALATFSALRRWNLALIERIPPEAFSKKLKHPERGELTLQVQIESMAGHDLNHLKQLETIAARA
jgi:DinB family protein